MILANDGTAFPVADTRFLSNYLRTIINTDTVFNIAYQQHRLCKVFNVARRECGEEAVAKVSASKDLANHAIHESCTVCTRVHFLLENKEISFSTTPM